MTIFKPLQFEPSFNALFTTSTSAQLLAAHGSIDGEGKETLKSAWMFLGWVSLVP
ncbi:hypothetical protein OHW19_11930 [Acinetobacter baumannii]|nr:hypothetical protein [Acinetobacter baumannii]HCA5035396.1 hypothetical protein [Acinetobacter baumannii]